MPGDEFYILVTPKRTSKLKFAFEQHIFRTRDDKLVVAALITGTSVNERGRPFVPAEIDLIFPPEAA